jgi:hypothetical protein
MQIPAEMTKVSALFLEQSHLRLLGSKSWVIPIQRAEIQMKTVVRSQMDVLMKMILKILERLEVKQANEISELLAVESMFIDHMLNIMIHNKMVEKIEDTYQLTTIGLAELKKGTFVHDSMEEHVEIVYSPYHKEVLNQDHEQNVMDENENASEFLFEEDVFLADVTKLDDTQIRQVIQDSDYEFIVENGQKSIEEICLVELKETMRVVCFEFHLHDRTEDMFFIRVWNTWTGQFDSRFEDELSQKKASKLRELYKM